MCDSAKLREVFSYCKEQIEDGWTILGEGDDGDYGSDLLMLLRGPDGKLYEQAASCCSCYGIDDQWGPVESSVEAIKKTMARYLDPYGDNEPGQSEPDPSGYYLERWKACRDALKALGEL